MKALICAAGDSKRMGELTKNIPKPLLPLANSTIIENIIKAIATPPINEIIILTGYLEEQIKNKIGDNFNGIKISYVRNDLFSITNNMYSLLLAKDKINEDIIFISGDVFLKKETYRNFIQNSNPNSILIDNNPCYFVDEDPVKVTIENNRITAIDKKLSLFQTKGVAPGLYRMSHEVFHEFFNIAEYLIEKGFVNYGYIEPIKILIKKYNFIPHLIGNESWFDIDTIEEYKTIKREIDNLEDRRNKDEI